REHQEDGEQEHAEWRDELGPLAMDIAAGELARLPREQRQGAPELAIEVQHAVDQVVADRRDGAVDMALLAAHPAIGAGQFRPAIRAVALGLVRRLARPRLGGAGEHAARHRIADAFDSAHAHLLPFPRICLPAHRVESLALHRLYTSDTFPL